MEAFGRVTVEAMMSGSAVIGSNSGCTKELISNNENGLLFKQGNYKDLANKIKYLYNNRKEIQRLGNNAYVYSEKNCLINLCAEKIYKLYTEIKR